MTEKYHYYAASLGAALSVPPRPFHASNCLEAGLIDWMSRV